MAKRVSIKKFLLNLFIGFILSLLTYGLILFLKVFIFGLIEVSAQRAQEQIFDYTALVILLVVFLSPNIIYLLRLRSAD